MGERRLFAAIKTEAKNLNGGSRLNFIRVLGVSLLFFQQPQNKNRIKPHFLHTKQIKARGLERSVSKLSLE